ncbi:MAG: ATP-dependent RNA helicase HrpA [Desulfobulbus sp.]|jgi:ATP-dependent helicase HrpA
MQLFYPPELPVCERREEIVAAIRNHQVLIVQGDTGSGKTTQLPKMCLEAGRGQEGLIGCTQPRRIAALAVADRLGEELRAPDMVGVKIRFHDQTGPATRIKFMTDGVLLAETRRDRRLALYDTLIVDEAHERGLNIDFLLGYLKNLLPVRPELKLIISSATIDTEKFSRHFNDAPVLTVSGRTFPVTTIHSEDEVDEDELSYVDQAVAVVEELAAQPLGGDILVFMPTERDITDTLDALRHLEDRLLLLPLFGRLPAADQRRIFRPAAKRKVVVATNVAETSITVPGIRFVVDTGLARIARYNPRTGATSLKVSRISQASCEQRRGRCGRTGPGTCIRLYSEDDFLSRPAFTLPEIQRSNLAEVILQMISLNLGDPARFPFIDPPPAAAIRDGYAILRELGAVHGGRRQRLSANGRLMARLPLDPRIARIIIEGRAQGVQNDITILAAALSIQDPRVRPLGKEFKADEAHRAFADRRSDFLALLNIWKALFPPDSPPPSNSALSRFCTAHFLSRQRVREWMDIHDQISRLLKGQRQQRPRRQSAETDYDALHIALASGFLRNICQKKEKNIYLSAGNKEVVLFPGSALYNKGPQWLIAAEFVETSQLFARIAGAVMPEWLERLGGELCKRSWSDPRWEKKSGRVLALERVSLFGLIIVSGRKVDYARINEQTRAEARELFIRAALVEGQLGGRFRFLAANLALVARFQEMEERFRRRNLVVDDEVLFQFYDTRLGPEIYDRFTLANLLRDREQEAGLLMSEEDICLARPDSDELYRFPLSLRAGEIELTLDYLFAPGDPADGVTVRIPRHLVAGINPQVFEWLVPGLLPDKILLLCKSLPKQLRRRLVPLPDTVDRLMDGLSLYQGSLYQELERVLLRVAGVRVERSDWRIDNLPAHLRMRFQLVDESGTVLMVTRVFDELLDSGRTATAQHSSAAGAAPAARAARATHAAGVPTQRLPPPRPIDAEELDSIGDPVPITSNQALVAFAFPVLRIRKNGTVELDHCHDEDEARRENQRGVLALLALRFPREMTALRKLGKKSLTSRSASWLSLGARMPAAELRAQLHEFLLQGVFTQPDAPLPSWAWFQAEVERVQEAGLVRAATLLLDQVETFLGQRRAVHGRIHAWAERSKAQRHYQQERHEEYLHELERIAPEQFLRLLRPDELHHRIRYLQALELRIERAEHAPHKDRAKAKRLDTPEARLREMDRFTRPSPPCAACMDEYRELLDEFRVSLFAPELGTAQPVSEQRLQQKWQEVENNCRRIE